MCICGGCEDCLRAQGVKIPEPKKETEDEHYNRRAEEDFQQRLYEQGIKP